MKMVSTSQEPEGLRLFKLHSVKGTQVMLAAVALYLVLRSILAAYQPMDSMGFGHDSAYLWIVARNVLEGRGFVNDAHWLVFLDPPALPIPYHNGGPLYPLLTAATFWLARVDVALAGFLVSAWSGVLLVPAVGWLAHQYTPSWTSALCIGFVAGLFDPVFKLSFGFGPEALSALLLAVFLAAAVGRGRFTPVTAGVLLGLAWLSRSDSVLVVPAVIVYLAARDGVRFMIRRMAVIGATAVMIISPWLLHTNSVWGTPLRSDSAYYLLQDWHSMRGGIKVIEYWHSTETPAGLGEVVRSDPIGFAAHVVKGVPLVVRKTLAFWASDRVWVGVVLLLMGSAGFATMWRRRRAELAGLTVLTLTWVGVFAIRSASFEPRYFTLLAVLFAVIVTLGFADLAQRAWRSRAPQAAAGLLAVSGLACLFVPSASSAIALRRANERLIAYTSFANAVSAESRLAGPVVVGGGPYFFTKATGQGALSFPFSDDDYLLRYMSDRKSVV